MSSATWLSRLSASLSAQALTAVSQHCSRVGNTIASQCGRHLSSSAAGVGPGSSCEQLRTQASFLLSHQRCGWARMTPVAHGQQHIMGSAWTGSAARSSFGTMQQPWTLLRQVRAKQTDATPAPGKPKQPPASAAELGLYWGAAAVAMVGLSYAMVPLYKMFCAATGYGGTLGGIETVESKLRRRMEKPNEKVEKAAAEREITVWFNADVAEDMPWEFTPTQEYVKVRPGQSTLVFFTAKNKSDKPVTGYSVYNVTPDKAAVYFNKIQCFCFEMQRLRGSEEIDMPVFFYLDPEVATDWNCRNVNDITLSYMFHKIDDEDLDEADLADDAPTVIKLHGHGPGGGLPAPMGAAAMQMR